MSRAGNSTELPLLYFNGSYYTAHDFTCGGTTYPKGLKVRACNGQAPDALVQALSRSGVALDWDYDRNKYYTTRFYKYAPAAKSNSAVTLELAGTQRRFHDLGSQRGQARPMAGAAARLGPPASRPGQ